MSQHIGLPGMTMKKLMTCASYVMYKDSLYLVLQTTTNDLVKIFNPLATNSKQCLQVKSDKLTLVNKRPATILIASGRTYIVTAKDLIISLTTNKIMKWADDNGNRIKILKQRDDIIASYAFYPTEQEYRDM